MSDLGPNRSASFTQAHWSGRVAKTWKVSDAFTPTAPTTGMPDPTVANDWRIGFAFDKYQQACWVVFGEDGATSFKVALYRWVESIGENGVIFAAGRWVFESTSAAITGTSLPLYQYVNGDLLHCRVYDITAGKSVQVLHKGANKGA